MGVYYMVVNEERREYLDAHSIDCGAKLGEWIHGMQSGVLFWLMSEDWSGDVLKIISDGDDFYYDVKDDLRWRDVGPDAIRQMKEQGLFSG